jgi:hypothetical protein
VAAACIGSVAELLVARTRTRADDALREPSGDAFASPNAFVSSVFPDHDDDNDSSHRHESAAREANARTVDQVPAASRGFEGLPDWAGDQVGEVVVTPIVNAYAEATGRHTSIDVDWFIDELLGWPRGLGRARSWDPG